MPLKIVSGGQTGADRDGWRAARRLGLRAGGWMPSRFETEDGPRPEFAQLYGAIAMAGEYNARTHANAYDSDATVWFGDPTSAGGVATFNPGKFLDGMRRPVSTGGAGRFGVAMPAGWS